MRTSGTLSEKRVADQLPRDFAMERRIRRPLPEKVESRLPADISIESTAGFSFIAREQFADRPPAPQAPASILRLMKSRNWGKAIDELEGLLRADPDDLEAHYLKGICHRELAQNFFLNVNRKRAVRHFEFVLERDSLYRDVIHQYAMTWRYYEKFDRAITLGQHQTRLRPDLEHAHFGLFYAYRHFVHTRKPKDAIKWLANRSTELDAYYLAEADRLDGRLEEARDVMLDLVKRDTLSFSKQPVYLSLARIYYARRQPILAQNYVTLAIETIQNGLDAQHVWEDAKFVVNTGELHTYQQIAEAAEWVDFFNTIWTSRDPMPAREENVRLTEHYRRLLYAEREFVHVGLRSWHTNPDQLLNLQLPETHDVNQEYNDMGLIYIRHGEPGDRIQVVGGFDGGVSQSWRYYDPALDFHFTIAGGGNNWRLTPVPPESAYEDLQVWGGLYARLSRMSRMEAFELRGELTDQSRQMAQQGLNTDQQTWEDWVEPLDFPHVVAAFKGEDDQARLEIHYAVPTGEIARKAKADPMPVEVGLALHNTDWDAIAEYNEVLQLPRPGDRSTAYVQVYELPIDPGTYQLSIHIRPVDTRLLGGYTYEHTIPSFDRPALTMSDLLPAYRIDEPEDGLANVRTDLNIVANPTLRFPKDELIYMYYELYNLTFDENDRTRYKVRYALSPINERRGLSRLLRGNNDSSISVETQFTGLTTRPIEYVQIDASRVSSGKYNLIVEVTDEITGSVVSKTLEVELK